MGPDRRGRCSPGTGRIRLLHQPDLRLVDPSRAETQADRFSMVDRDRTHATIRQPQPHGASRRAVDAAKWERGRSSALNRKELDLKDRAIRAWLSSTHESQLRELGLSFLFGDAC